MLKRLGFKSKSVGDKKKGSNGITHSGRDLDDSASKYAHEDPLTKIIASGGSIAGAQEIVKRRREGLSGSAGSSTSSHSHSPTATMSSRTTKETDRHRSSRHHHSRPTSDDHGSSNGHHGFQDKLGFEPPEFEMKNEPRSRSSRSSGHHSSRSGHSSFHGHGSSSSHHSSSHHSSRGDRHQQERRARRKHKGDRMLSKITENPQHQHLIREVIKHASHEQIAEEITGMIHKFMQENHDGESRAKVERLAAKADKYVSRD